MKKNMMVAVVLGIAAVACTGPAMDIAGDAMVTVGDAMRSNADVGDARADVMEFEVPCTSETGTRTVTSPGSTQVSTTTYWSATLSMASIDRTRVRGLHAVVCGYESSTEQFPDPRACPAGATCTGMVPTTPAQLDCVVSDAQFEEGVARVWCGSEQSILVTNAEGVRVQSYDSVTRGRTARFVVDLR